MHIDSASSSPKQELTCRFQEARVCELNSLERMVWKYIEDLP